MEPNLRVSDQERDEVVELLRQHRMAGRLDADEHEERVAEACAARYGRELSHALRELPPPAPPPLPASGPPVFVQPLSEEGDLAVGVAVAALLVLLFTGGIAALVALPLGIWGWRLAARSEHGRGLRLGRTATAVSAFALVLWVVWLLAVVIGADSLV